MASNFSFSRQELEQIAEDLMDNKEYCFLELRY